MEWGRQSNTGSRKELGIQEEKEKSVWLVEAADAIRSIVAAAENRMH